MCDFPRFPLMVLQVGCQTAVLQDGRLPVGCRMDGFVTGQLPIPFLLQSGLPVMLYRFQRIKQIRQITPQRLDKAFVELNIQNPLVPMIEKV